MANKDKNTLYNGRQYACSQCDSLHNGFVLQCIDTNNIYCVNNIEETKKNKNPGIIAGLGNNEKITFLVKVDLNKDNKRAKVNITYLYKTVDAPAPNQAMFLDQIPVPAEKVYSLDITYKFGLKIERELNASYKKHCAEEMQKHDIKPVVIQKQKSKGYC